MPAPANFQQLLSSLEAAIAAIPPESAQHLDAKLRIRQLRLHLRLIEIQGTAVKLAAEFQAQR